MSCLAPSTTSFQSTEIINQRSVSGEPQQQRCASFSCYVSWLSYEPMVNSPGSASIHILDDDSLLHIFYLYRPFVLGKDNDDDAHLLGDGRWICGRWWYKPAHVCQRWRNIILGSSFYLDVSLVCTNGTPVAGMLAHSPPLSLVVDYLQNIATSRQKMKME